MVISNCSVLSIPGCGNISSVCRSFKHIGISPSLLTPSSNSLSADLLILPGVGSFENAMQFLNSSELLPLILNHIQSGRPTIGICLGFQILCRSSSETSDRTVSSIPGLSFFDHIRLIDLTTLTMQMNVGPKPLYSSKKKSNSFSGLFYFMHRYGFVLPSDSSDLPAVVHSYSHHSSYRVAAICQKDSIWGIQFHPEKSGSSGLELLNQITNSF